MGGGTRGGGEGVGTIGDGRAIREGIAATNFDTSTSTTIHPTPQVVGARHTRPERAFFVAELARARARGVSRGGRECGADEGGGGEGLVNLCDVPRVDDLAATLSVEEGTLSAKRMVIARVSYARTALEVSSRRSGDGRCRPRNFARCSRSSERCAPRRTRSSRGAS